MLTQLSRLIFKFGSCSVDFSAESKMAPRLRSSPELGEGGRESGGGGLMIVILRLSLNTLGERFHTVRFYERKEEPRGAQEWGKIFMVH